MSAEYAALSLLILVGAGHRSGPFVRRPMKILFLTRYDRRGASSRQRCFLYLEALREAGIAADVHPFLSDSYIDALYSGTPGDLGEILRSYLARLRALTLLSRYDT